MSGARRSSRSSRPGCGPSVPRSRATPPWPRRWITCSSAGTASPASSTTAASASRNNAAERALRPLCLGRRFLALRRVRPRRRASRSHVHPHRHRQVERRRSSGLARRRPQTASPSSRRPGCTNSSPGTGRLSSSRPSPHSLRPPPDGYGESDLSDGDHHLQHRRFHGFNGLARWRSPLSIAHTRTDRRARSCSAAKFREGATGPGLDPLRSRKRARWHR